MKLFSIVRCGGAGCAVVLFMVGRSAAQSTPDVSGNWTQTWADEFNNGSSDLNSWTYNTGNNNGWGNGEYENYTSSSSNVYVSNGNLNIAAIASGSGANETYTSGRITTQNLFNQKYGLIEFQATLPAAMTTAGTGLWPAVWMMPENSTYGGWPTSGEMDILESDQSNFVQGSLHSGADSSTEDNQTAVYDPSGFNATQTHTYDLEWSAPSGNNPGSIEWFVDGKLYETQTGGWYDPKGSSDPEAPFDQPFYLIVNLAVGGSYVGGAPNLPDGTYDMQINYIRAYEVATPEPTMLAPLLACAALAARRRRRPITR